MAKELNAKEIGEIFAEQVGKLRGADAGNFDVKLSDAIANILGKTIKLAAQEMAYAKARGKDCPDLPSLTR